MEQEQRKSSLDSQVQYIARWMLAVSLFIGGFSQVGNSGVSALLVSLSGILICPPVVDKISVAIKRKFGFAAQFGTVVGAFILLIAYSPSTPKEETFTAEQVQQIVDEALEEQPQAVVNDETSTNEATPTEELLEEPEPVTTTPTVTATDIVSEIEDAIGMFEVTVWTSGGDFATASSTPPFEVIVNTTASQISSCTAAKNALFEIMKSVYSDPSLKSKVSRIKFTAWGQLKASLGANDATFDWSSTGPTNLWTVLLQYKPYQDESGSLSSRTWGEKINGSCE